MRFLSHFFIALSTTRFYNSCVNKNSLLRFLLALFVSRYPIVKNFLAPNSSKQLQLQSLPKSKYITACPDTFMVLLIANFVVGFELSSGFPAHVLCFFRTLFLIPGPFPLLLMLFSLLSALCFSSAICLGLKCVWSPTYFFCVSTGNMSTSFSNPCWAQLYPRRFLNFCFYSLQYLYLLQRKIFRLFWVCSYFSLKISLEFSYCLS